MSSRVAIQRENLKRVTAMPFCCPNCARTLLLASNHQRGNGTTACITPSIERSV